MDPDGRSNFRDLLFRREAPFFLAFDVLAIDGTDLRHLPLIQRKSALTRIMPRIESRLLFVDHIEERGIDLFRAACEPDLEGVVGKLLKSDPVKVKSEFRRLNLKLTFNPVEAEPRPHFVVQGQCDLSALAISFVQPATHESEHRAPVWPCDQGAVLDRLREGEAR